MKIYKVFNTDNLDNYKEFSDKAEATEYYKELKTANSHICMHICIDDNDDICLTEDQA